MRSDAFGAFNQSQRKDTHNLSESFQTRTVRNNQMTNQTQAWEMKDLFDAERSIWLQSNGSGYPKGAISAVQPRVLLHIAS